MRFSFSDKSKRMLEGVHPDLVRVVNRAMSMQIMDFRVAEGVRTLTRQKQLVSEGLSQTLKSLHLVQSDGYGHAVDLYPYPIDMRLVIKGQAKEISRFGILSGIMLTCAILENVPIVSGMDWNGDGQTLDHTFFDAPHFQLSKVNITV